MVHILTQDLNYWDLKRRDIKRGNFTDEQKEMIRKAQAIQKEKYKNIKFVNTNTGRFLSSPSQKFGKWMSAKELKSAIGTLTQFNSSRFTTVEYTREYVEETKAKLGIQDENLLKSVYKVFREFGFAGRWDSGNILSDIAEWHDITGRTDMAELLQEFIDDYNDNMTADSPPMDTDMLRGHVSDLVADLYDWE